MGERCDFRAERECSCGPNECRVQMVYVKPRPMPYPKTHYLSGAVVCVAVWGLFVAMNGGFS